MYKPRRTAKQKELMGIILKAAGEGKFLTQKELHAKVSYKCTYGAIRVSVRFLEKLEMLELRRTGRAVLLHPTEKAYDWFRLGT